MTDAAHAPQEPPSLGARAAPLLPVLVILVGVLAGWPLFGAAFPATHDGLIHLLRQQQFEVVLADTPYPRWAPDVLFGLGAPIFSYYPPLTYYVTALLGAAGLGPVAAWHGMALLALLSSGVTMYFLARQYLSRPGATLAACAYLLAPYHLLDIMIRGTLPEAFAFTWIPLVLLGIERIFTGSLRYWLALTLGLAALLLTHLITAVLCLPLFALWTLSAFLRRRAQEDPLEELASTGASVAVLALAVTAAAGLAAVSLLPTALEQGLIQLQNTRVPGNDVGFVALGYLLGTSLQQAWNVLEIEALFEGVLNFPQLVLFGAGAAMLFRWRSLPDASRHVLVIGIVVTVAAVLLVDPRSRPLWDLAGGASFVWFPFRLLTIACLTGALVIGFAAEHASGTARQVLALGAVALMAWSILPGLRPLPTSITDAFQGPLAINAFERTWGGPGLAATGEYFPAGMDARRQRSPAVAPVFGDRPPQWGWSAGGGLASIEALTTGPTLTEYRVVLDRPDRVILARSWFPWWRADLDGRLLALDQEPGSGLMSLTVPAGEHRLRIALAPSPSQAIGAAITLTSLAVLPVLVLVTLFLWNRQRSDARRIWYVVIAGGLGALVVGAGWLVFRDASPLPAEHAWLEYGDGDYLRLQGPPLLTPFSAGDTVPVLLEARFRTLDPPVVALDVTLTDGSRAIARERIPLVEGLVPPREVRLPVPAGALPGAYAVQADPVTPTGDIPRPFAARSVPLVNTGGLNRTLPIAIVVRETPPPIPAATRLDGDWTVASTGWSTPGGGDATGEIRVPAGSSVTAALVLQAGGADAQLPGLTVRLRDEAGLERASATVDRASLLPLGRGWLPGDLVRHTVTLRLPADLPPGPYTADLLVTNAAGPVLEPGTAQLLAIPLPPIRVTPPLPGTAATPPSGEPLLGAAGIRLDQAILLSPAVRPGQALPVDLLWSGGPGTDDLVAILRLRDTSGRILGEARQVAGSASYRTRDWLPGSVLRTRLLVPVSRDAPGGAAGLEIQLEGSAGPLAGPAPAGSVTIDTRQVSFDPPLLHEAVTADFGGILRLTGFSLAGTRTADGYVPGSELQVRLAWEALRTPARQLQATVQLLDTAGRLVAQQDRLPGQDGVPVPEWVPGEFQVGEFTLTIPRGQAGTYRLVVAVYDPATGTRLATGNGNTLRLADILVADVP